MARQVRADRSGVNCIAVGFSLSHPRAMFPECKMCWLLVLISQTELENGNVNVSPFSGCLEDYLRESEVELTYQRHYTLTP